MKYWPVDATLLAEVLELLDDPTLIDGFEKAAACVGRAEEFVPDDDVVTDAARRVCHSCPVRAECLTEELQWPAAQPGLWGGLDQPQRRRLREGLRGLGRTAAKAA